jgi:hypothetical protein
MGLHTCLDNLPRPEDEGKNLVWLICGGYSLSLLRVSDNLFNDIHDHYVVRSCALLVT